MLFDTTARHAALFATACLLLTSCTPLGLVNGLSPSGHYEVEENLPYGEHHRQTLNVYTSDVKTIKPMIIFFYGGGWRDGNKEDYEFVASSLTKAGYVVVIPDYRVFPEVVFPTFVEDGADAVTWAIQNANRFGADSNNVFLMGHSAGAHIAALLATDHRFLKSRDVNPEHLRGLVGLSGPYNFLPLTNGYLLDAFPENKRAASQPINFVSAKTPPTLLIHGTDDAIVWAVNSQTFAERLVEHGVPVSFKLYEGQGHAETVASLAPPLDFTGRTLEDSLAFMDKLSGLDD